MTDQTGWTGETGRTDQTGWTGETGRTDETDENGGTAGPIARVAAVSLDCADPDVLARFYLDLLGGRMLWRSDGSAGISVPGLVLVLQRVMGYQPPAWPGSSLVHLDLAPETDLDHAVAGAARAGGVVPGFQPDPRWRVLLDPAGHPFCLTTVTPGPEPSALCGTLCCTFRGTSANPSGERHGHQA